MKELIKGIFEEQGYKVKGFDYSNKEVIVFINDKDETYIILFSNLSKKLVNDVFNLCSEKLYNSRELSRANKSNLSVFIISLIDGDKLTEEQERIVFEIEENELYFKKFVLWYNNEELKEFRQLCNEDFSYKVLQANLLNYNLFCSFKKDKLQEKSYSLLSRIFIKIPFLTLLNINKYEKKLTDIIQDRINEINPTLYNYICESSNKENKFNGMLDLVTLEDKELKEINEEIKKLEKRRDENNEK